MKKEIGKPILLPANEKAVVVLAKDQKKVLVIDPIKTKEINKASFLEEITKKAIKVFEEKEVNKPLIEKMRNQIANSAEKGGFVYRCDNMSLNRYFCLKYGFKSNGAFLML